jgi:DNA-binding NarL/FixJ family response regulator
LYVALTVYFIVDPRTRAHSAVITLGAIVLFTITAAVRQDLYRGTTAGLILAATGVVAHAIASLVSRRDDKAPGHSSEVAVQSAGLAASSAPTANPPTLTPRETEVLRAAADGVRTSEIAERLSISERTVKAHLANIYQKLGVDSRTAAVALAHRNGWV